MVNRPHHCPLTSFKWLMLHESRGITNESCVGYTMSHSQDLYFRIFGLYSLVSIGKNIQILKPWNILLRLNKDWTDILVHCSFFQSLKHHTVTTPILHHQTNYLLICDRPIPHQDWPDYQAEEFQIGSISIAHNVFQYTSMDIYSSIHFRWY